MFISGRSAITQRLIHLEILVILVVRSPSVEYNLFYFAQLLYNQVKQLSMTIDYRDIESYILYTNVEWYLLFRKLVKMMWLKL